MKQEDKNQQTHSLSAAQATIGKHSTIDEPYSYVSGGSFSGPAEPLSPDPLVRYRWPSPQASDDLEVYLLSPKEVVADSPSSFTGLESLTTERPAVTVKGPGTIRIDFGQENAGWFEIDSPDCPGDLRLSISEYNQPEYTNVGDKTVVPERIGDTWRAKFNPEFYEGVRFAFIHVDAVAKPWQITGIRLVCQVKPSNYEGGFHSNDSLLTRIWHMGAYTVKICNLKEFTTPILIERGDRVLWNGLDFYIYNSVNIIAFNNASFVRQQIAKVNTAPGVNCNILGYEMYDVLSVCEYFRLTGDATLVRECQAMVLAKLDKAQDRWDTYLKVWENHFMGWDERLGSGFESAPDFNFQNYRVLCIRAWLTWANVMDKLGEAGIATGYRSHAEKRINELRQNPNWIGKLDVHGCAEAVQAGICTSDELRAIIEGEFNDRVNRVSYCPANTGLIIEAMGRVGLYDEALTTMQDQWGAMLRYGGTTTFEMFHPSAADVLGPNDPPINGQCGMTSLCHPWGSGPCQYLNEVVAGIVPTSPGYATVDIFPHLGRLLTEAGATTPTPHGPITARCDVKAGVSHVTLPNGVTGRIGIPKVERRITKIIINGSFLWDGEFHPVPGIGGASEDSEFVVFQDVQPGTYHFLITYEGTTPAAKISSKIYPVKCLGEDRTTKGNWGGIYGNDGYVLPDYDGVGKDVRALPHYVNDVIYQSNLCQHMVWATEVEDNRALARDRSNGGPRTAAAIYTKDPAPSMQTMFFDISTKEHHDYTLALYFVDWDSHDRNVGVQIIDLISLKQLAPVQVVRNYHEGVYLKYRCAGSIRVRIDTITKPNATLSGVFFSS